MASQPGCGDWMYAWDCSSHFGKYMGLSALLNMSAQVFSILKLAGALYLLYLQAFAVSLAGFAVKLAFSEK